MEKKTSKDIIFNILLVIIGILTTIMFTGLGINWYNGCNITSVGDSLMIIPFIVLACAAFDFVVWAIICAVIYGLFYELD